MRYLLSYNEHTINEGMYDRFKSLFKGGNTDDDDIVKDIIDNHHKIVDIKRDKNNYTTFIFNYKDYGAILSVTFTNASDRESEDEFDMILTDRKGGKNIQSKYLKDLYNVVRKKYRLK